MKFVVLSIVGLVSLALGGLLAWTVSQAKMEHKNRWLKYTLLTKAVAFLCAGVFLIAYGLGLKPSESRSLQ